jgi:pyruvate dehydrogenase E2 component (dihydrolipoamide acetyltransferase)
MPRVPLTIPAIGEGLQEARLVAVLKQPGDRIRRDEVIYQMETDKAVMDVESPVDGVLVEWKASVDTLLAIGAEVGLVDTESAVAVAPDAPAPSTPAPASVAVATASDIVQLTIPAIGEGLQEARLVATLKQPGESIKRDEIIYQMETDKAVMDVESPYDGVLVEWLATVDTLLAIGAPVGTIRTSTAVAVTSAAPTPALATASVASAAPSVSVGGPRRLDMPPRTRAYAKEKGLTEAQLSLIPASGSKLMPADIDAYLGSPAPVPSSGVRAAAVGGAFAEQPLSQKQRLLSSRLVRGTQLVVPGTITVATKWGPIEAARARVKASGDAFQPSAFTMFAYAVAVTLRDFPMFRSTLVGDGGTLRTYDHANLGIAVALPGDELVLAVVEGCDRLGWREFADKARAQIDLARGGKDQANESVTISLTNMQAFGLRDAVPVVVPPSVGTLFLGEPYNGLDQSATEPKLCRYVNLALTFDHRLINGVGAAEFINAIRKNVEEIDVLVS